MTFVQRLRREEKTIPRSGCSPKPRVAGPGGASRDGRRTLGFMTGRLYTEGVVQNGSDEWERTVVEPFQGASFACG